MFEIVIAKELLLNLNYLNKMIILSSWINGIEIDKWFIIETLQETCIKAQVQSCQLNKQAVNISKSAFTDCKSNVKVWMYE